MIIKINLTKPFETVSINNQHKVNGFIHNLIGNNNKWHDIFSRYAISSLQGGKLNKDGNLDFPTGAYILVSSLDMELISTIMCNSLSSNASMYGMKIQNITTMDFAVKKYYDKIYTVSPVLLKHDGKKISFKDEGYITLLKAQCIKKLEHEGIKDAKFDIKLRNPEKAKVKKIMVGDIFNIATMASFEVYGKQETRSTLYNMGLGNSTGCGFGFVKVAD